MIARVWAGSTRTSDADEYARYLEGTGVPDLQATPGNRGVYVLRRVDGEHAEFVVVSLWGSLKEVKAFAGKDVDRAVYYPDDAQFLLGPPRGVAHYEVVLRP